jgi:hypothetical protein
VIALMMLAAQLYCWTQCQRLALDHGGACGSM